MPKVKLASGELRETKHISEHDLKQLVFKSLVAAEKAAENMTDEQRVEYKRLLIISLLGGAAD